jgi:hypothetical protein
MSPIVYRMMDVLNSLVVCLPVGTNLALLHVLWAVSSGQLLAQRGALVPALTASGLSREAVRRAWRALASGRWQCARLVAALGAQVQREGLWQAHVHGGYRPVACDLTAFYRPNLHDCHTSHYHGQAQRQLRAIPFGVAVRVGSVNSQRVPVLVAIVRAPVNQANDTELMQRTLVEVAQQLGADEAVVVDRGFTIPLVQGAGIERYVVRCLSNFAPCRADPVYCGQGRRPLYGPVVRPLERHYKKKMLDATPPDSTETWQEETRKGTVTVTAQVWERLTTKKSPKEAPCFRCVLIYDPRFRKPLMLATTLPVSVRDLCALYRDRWPVEMVPQTAKQMLGAERQFVSGDETRQRLPEVTLVAAGALLYTAATLPPCPTGFWDRQPRATSGRLRRTLAQASFPQSWPFSQTIRKKASVTGHLPKGIDAHRRQPATPKTSKRPQHQQITAQLTRN